MSNFMWIGAIWAMCNMFMCFEWVFAPVYIWIVLVSVVVYRFFCKAEKCV